MFALSLEDRFALVRSAAFQARVTDQRRRHGVGSAHLNAEFVEASLRAAVRDPGWREQQAADVDWAKRCGVHLLFPFDEQFPPWLKEIPDAPLCLFVRSNAIGASAPRRLPEWLTTPGIAIVGTRRPTPSGQRFAEQLAAELSATGLPIISGLALGIDAAVHRGVLQAGGITVAVMASGLRDAYPARNRRIAHQILQSGAWVGELLPEITPRPRLFPARNRLVCGLALGVVVVEAGLPSGSLVTARLALEQGREVMAVPGSPVSEVSRGCHQLIREGAVLIENADDVVSALTLERAPFMESGARADNEVRISPSQQALLARLDHGQPLTVDHLLQDYPHTMGQLMADLSHLEIDGSILAVAGGYIRVTGPNHRESTPPHDR